LSIGDALAQYIITTNADTADGTPQSVVGLDVPQLRRLLCRTKLPSRCIWVSKGFSSSKHRETEFRLRKAEWLEWVCPAPIKDAFAPFENSEPEVVWWLVLYETLTAFMTRDTLHHLPTSRSYRRFQS
jgi:hypothetical protein